MKLTYFFLETNYCGFWIISNQFIVLSNAWMFTLLFVCECSFVDPEKTKAYILGEANSTQIVTLNKPATVRCLAGGYPKPFISWWKGTELLPYKSTRFEVTQEFSLVFNQIELSDLGPYICQAYSGSGKPVSKYVTLRAIGPVHTNNDDDRQYFKYLIDAPSISVTPQVHYPNIIHRPTPRVPVHEVAPIERSEVGKYI